MTIIYGKICSNLCICLPVLCLVLTRSDFHHIHVSIRDLQGQIFLQNFIWQVHHIHVSELNEVLSCKIKLHLDSVRLTAIELSNSADNHGVLHCMSTVAK